jgi:hypothetical protein
MKMSVMRQFLRPLAWTMAFTGLYAGIALVIAMADGQKPIQAATTERIVTDRLTGLALYGIDPVAYFTEGAPREGLQDFELPWSGATWRFRNEGNRAAFMRDPSIYEPRFGGYDPVAIGEGNPATGHPSVWSIHRDRLYVFHSERNRALFAAAPDQVIAKADSQWPAVLATLAP